MARGSQNLGDKPTLFEPETIAASFESIEIGRKIRLGSYIFDEERILRFARAFDPQPFHLDPTAAAQSHFGTLAASGWHTAAAFMRQLVDAKQRSEASARQDGRISASAGPGLGFKDLRWREPVRLGDIVTYSSTPLGKRPTSRSGWGVVTSLNEGLNQHGVAVFEFTSATLWPMRETI